MGKQGPCYHCGVSSTPLWRNGPPDKPVLCNACGSRWRTKGTLANYTPLHSRVEHENSEDHEFTKIKSISVTKRDMKLNKRKLDYHNTMVAGVAQDYNQSFQKILDEDTSNRSSSGSAVSNSESCAQFGSADMSDLTGPAQSIVWDTLVPSRKRTCVKRPKSSPVEKLTKDLYSILHEQQSSHISGSLEADLLFESEMPMVSVEIGHGSILFRHPSSMTREEESEASSFSVDYKHCKENEAYAHSALLFGHKDSKGVNAFSQGIDKVKKLSGQRTQPEQVKRDKSYYERLQTLWNHKSPLSHIDLIDIVNFDVFWGYLTADEQQQLLKYLPSGDTSTLPDGLRSMFASPHFKENLSSFQQLLAEGVFDTSSSGITTEECKTLKRHALSNLSKSKWVELYKILKDNRLDAGTEGRQVASGGKLSLTNHVDSAKKLHDEHNQHLADMKTTMRSPKSKGHSENNGLSFSPRSLFALPSSGSSLMLEPFPVADESSDHDMLLDVPSNASFLEAEFLLPALSSASQPASTSSSSVHQSLISL
ncbi:hypothetical protein Nepgr_028581 [Nepenthes gracilis]|uniref:GATA transcription factor n=1 Tax=Nepenthes gracilis TaxID=150966 RepID=A0AAD3TCL7_NEPGR|nr:hypothetical protein Nepgr_028581 [Nepenthes gracilis]